MAEAVRVPSLLPALLPAPSPAHAFLHKLFCALKPRVAAQQKSAAAAGDDDWDDDWDEEEDEVRPSSPLHPPAALRCLRAELRALSALLRKSSGSGRLRLALLDFFPSWPSCSCACPYPLCLSCSCSSTASSRPLTRTPLRCHRTKRTGRNTTSSKLPDSSRRGRGGGEYRARVVRGHTEQGGASGLGEWGAGLGGDSCRDKAILSQSSWGSLGRQKLLQKTCGACGSAGSCLLH